MGINAQSINKTLDNQRKLIDIAMLHQSNNTDIFSNVCVQDLLYPKFVGENALLGNCDGLIISHLTLVGKDPYEKGYGNNQTMIHLAYAYLKARGIH